MPPVRERVLCSASEALYQCGDGGYLGEHQWHQLFEQIELNVCDLFLQPQLGLADMALGG